MNFIEWLQSLAADGNECCFVYCDEQVREFTPGQLIADVHHGHWTFAMHSRCARIYYQQAQSRMHHHLN